MISYPISSISLPKPLEFFSSCIKFVKALTKWKSSLQDNTVMFPWAWVKNARHFLAIILVQSCLTFSVYNLIFIWGINPKPCFSFALSCNLYTTDKTMLKNSCPSSGHSVYLSRCRADHSLKQHRRQCVEFNVGYLFINFSMLWYIIKLSWFS